jgi:hypothetical protein
LFYSHQINHPRAITKLEKNIRIKIAAILVEMTQQMMGNFVFQNTTFYADQWKSSCCHLKNELCV